MRYPELEIATFDGMGCIMFDFQSYTGQFSFGSTVCQEIEVQIISYPKSLQRTVPTVSFREFLLGEDQTRLIGNHRIHVPCDSVVASMAGKMLFDEPKFAATFTSEVPSMNQPIAKTPTNSWKFACYDQSNVVDIGALKSFPEQTKLKELEQALANAPQNQKNLVYACDIDLTGLTSVQANQSPITEYGLSLNERKLTAARWDILQPLSLFFLEGSDKGRVKVQLGESTHKMKHTIETLIGTAEASAVYTYQTTPTAIQSRPFFVE